MFEVRGKMVGPSQVSHENKHLPLPLYLLQENKKLQLYADIRYLKNYPSL